MVWTTATKIDLDRRGATLEPPVRQLAESLRRQAFAVQQRFEIAEQSALMLDQMLDAELNVSAAVNNTYEAHAFNTLRLQLFRLLVVDLYAAVLDPDPRTSSVRALLKQLRRDSSSLDALKQYYGETGCLDIEVRGEGITADFVETERARVLEQHSEQEIRRIDDQWAAIEDGSKILISDAAKRIKWARSEVVVHFQKKEDGLVALDDDPPCGEGKLTWGEPIAFLRRVRPYVYDVYLMLTANSWDSESTDISRFYCRAFWDRFKNGTTDLQPRALG